jgi:hypothetical protein
MGFLIPESDVIQKLRLLQLFRLFELLSLRRVRKAFHLLLRVIGDKGDDIIKNIIDFITVLRANFKKSKIILIALFKSQDRTAVQLKKIDYINKKIRDYAMTTQNLFVYNFNRQLVSKNNFMEDKKHLSEKGYQTLSNCIKKLFLL